MKKSIFVGGTGRSGCTIVGKIIGINPTVYNFVETHFLVTSGGLRRILKSKDPKYTLKKRIFYSLNEIRKNCEELKPIYTKQMVIDLLKEDLRVYETIVKFFDIGLNHVNKQIMLNKTPHCVVQADLLYKMFPNFKMIHIFRNPYDVYASVKPLFWGPSNVKAFIKWYNKTMVDANRARKRIPKRNYMIMKMEDIVLKPRNMIEKISNFIGIKLGEDSVKLVNKRQAHMKRYENELSDEEIGEIRKNCMLSYDKWMKLYEKQGF